MLQLVYSKPTHSPAILSVRQAFQRAPPSWRRFSFVASYVAVAAAGSLNVLFTRAPEISGGVKVTDQTGEVRQEASQIFNSRTLHGS